MDTKLPRSDMGWLGYFIGKNQHLEKLFIKSFIPTSGVSVRDVLVPFFRGVSFNKSIREIHFYDVDLLGGEMFTMLGSFFRDNHNLNTINIDECDFELIGYDPHSHIKGSVAV